MVGGPFNRRNILAVSLIVWSAFTALCGLSRNYWQFPLARIGVGIGEAGGTPPSTAIVSDCFPPERRPMAMTVLALGAPIGAWIALDVAGEVARLYDWRHAFLALGIPGLVVGVIVYLTVREPARGRLDEIADDIKPSVKESLAVLVGPEGGVPRRDGGWRLRTVGLGADVLDAGVFEARLQIDVGQASDVTANIHLIGGSLATVGTAWLLSSRYMSDPRRVVWLLGGVVALTTIPSIIAYWTHSLVVARIMFWIFIPAIYFYIGPCFGLLNNLRPCHMRSMFIAVSLLVANVFNLIVAP